MTSYLICVTTFIFNNFILPGNTAAEIGTKPVAAHVCHICQAKFEDVSDRDDHTEDCLESQLQNGTVHIDQHPESSISAYALHRDFMWRHLFRTDLSSRIASGDGHRVHRILSRYMFALYEGSHSTNMVREAIRTRFYTDVKQGQFSAQTACQAMYEGIVNPSGMENKNMSIDLLMENRNADIQPGMRVLPPGHSTKEAQQAFKRRSFFASHRRGGNESLGLDQYQRVKRRRKANTIISRLPRMLLFHKIFNKTSSRRLNTIKESPSFRVGSMAKISTRRMVTTHKDTLADDLKWSVRLHMRKQEDDALIENAKSVLESI